MQIYMIFLCFIFHIFLPGIILVNFCTTFVASSMSSYIPALGMERGHSETAALLLITYNGAAGTIGKYGLPYACFTPISSSMFQCHRDKVFKGEIY